jgi:hypothetical protein
MKKILILLLSVFAYIPSFFCQSGGSMQFSRVLLIGTAVDTVPSGKVWKLESVLSSSQLAPALSAGNLTQEKTNSLQIKVNNTNISIASWLENEYSSYRGHTAFGQVTVLPIWLPAGSSVSASSNAAYISVIEFDILP